MSTRFATLSAAAPDARPDVAIGAIALDALAGAAAGAPPEWIKVTPRGAIRTRDGRPFTFEPEHLVSRWSADGIDLPVDLNHAVARKAMFGDAAEAVGWVKELAARPDGTYARIEWLPGGEAALAARTHRYVSPTFHHDESGLATWLHSVALVAAPALAMPALANAHQKPEKTMLKAVAMALGLAETSDEAACLAAIAPLTTRVDKAVHDQTLATLATTRDELTSLQAAVRKDKVARVLDEALKAKKLLPAQRAHYETLCATDEGLAEVEKLIAATPAQLAAAGLDGRQPVVTGETADPVALAAAAGAYRKKQANAGVVMSHAEAVLAVTEGKQ